MAYLIAGDMLQAHRSFESGVATKGTHLFEYHFAVAELERQRKKQSGG